MTRRASEAAANAAAAEAATSLPPVLVFVTNQVVLHRQGWVCRCMDAALGCEDAVLCCPQPCMVSVTRHAPLEAAPLHTHPSGACPLSGPQLRLEA